MAFETSLLQNKTLTDATYISFCIYLTFCQLLHSMRNDSDIFFLKEDDGNSGNLFSINGSCPMKIRRRRQTPQNDCFEYGRSETKLIEDSPKLFSDDKDDHDTEEAVIRHQSPNDDDETSEDKMEHQKECTEIEKRYESKTQDKKNQSITATSSMTRNILTGAGMEIVMHRKPKKGSNRREKNLW